MRRSRCHCLMRAELRACPAPGTRARRPPGAGERWPPGPSAPRLAPGESHVWLVHLANVPQAVNGLLSADERVRAGRILNARKGELWARSRGVLRDLLGAYLGVEPASVQFCVDSRGKPTLPKSPCVSFNLSHSGALALYGFSAQAPVGVDVELVGARSREALALAGRAFGAAGEARLAGLAPEERWHEFLRAWTRREAVFKCRGAVPDSASNPVSERTALRGPWIAELELGPAAVGAIALARPPRVLRCWSWGGTLQPA